GWPKSKRGRIYAISDPQHEHDPIIAETKSLIGSDWTKKSAEELARLLGHPDWRVRLEAQFTLAERGAASVRMFNTVLANAGSPPLARLHATWGLGQLAAKNAEALASIRRLITSGDSEVRAQAAKLLGD